MPDEIEIAKKAVETLNRGFEEFKAANDARLDEIEKKGAADALLSEKMDKIEEDLQKAQKAADDAVLAVKRSQRVVTDEKGNTVDLDAKAHKWARTLAKRFGTDAQAFDHDGMTAYKAAFNVFMRTDEKTLDGDQIKALSVGKDPDGGYVVHPDMNGQVVNQVYETSPMRAYASVQVISTDSLEGLYDLNEVGSGWVAETEARTETTTPELGRWRIPVHEIYANPRATQKILDDAEINMEQWLAGKVADRFARQEADAFVNGNGVGKPRGFLTYDSGTTLPGQIERVNTGVDGAFAASGDGAGALYDAIYKLKGPYRANASWFMNRTTTGLARKLQDGDGNYIWTPNAAAGQAATLAGYAIAPFEDMPDPATDSLSIAFGDMRAAYQIVDRFGIRVLRDPYSAKPYVEFYSTKRVGGDVLNFEAIKLIEFTA